jgi:glycosyltransferase involved in cell wall biosynthesis
MPAHRLSVVVPMYNEESLAVDLIEAVQKALQNYPQP